MDFDAFFAAMHGYAPFPWQVRAAHALLSPQPFVVKAPTSAGKTALIDAALYAAAFGGRRRIVFIVDRRIIVDAAYDRACTLRDRLSAASDPDLKSIATRLGEVEVVRLRGGVQGDDDFVLYPERTCVVLSTVDQVGSRLLHRGYGVSPRRWPMHAGFFGTDALYVIDEAHLSGPFLATLASAQSLGADIRVVPMSATLEADAGSVELGADDLAHPLLKQRLAARKMARLIEAAPGETRFVAATVEAAQAHLQDLAVRTLAIVVNRVATARAVHSALKAKKAAEDIVLMTGRTRPLDAERITANVVPRLQAGRSRSAGTPRLIVVATQTIEVGADFDFDALVTESAPLSSLRQRFGRLDRLGQLGQTQASIIHRAPGKAADPVYGEALADCWVWLSALAKPSPVDFGITALDQAIETVPPPAVPAAAHATLLPAHMDALACTGHAAPEVDLGAWLHGPERPAAEVNIVWRADLALAADGSLGAEAIECVRLMPPSTGEALAVPIRVARAWLGGARAVEVTDIQASLEVDAVTATVSNGRQAIRWRDMADCSVVALEALRPGDTLVVPAAYGGCDRWGWHPESVDPVEDIAEAALVASSQRGRRFAVRLAPANFDGPLHGEHHVQQAVEQLQAARALLLAGQVDSDDEVIEAEAVLLAALRASDHPWLRVLGERLQLDEHPQGFVVRQGIDDSDETGYLDTGVAVGLEVHHRDVAQVAAELARGHVHADEVVQAAAVHDAGKAEPRFQALLRGRPMAAGEQLLAKSGARSRRARLAALRDSGLPRGFRHELATVAGMTDPMTLVAFLVGSHHGVARPWAPTCGDAQAAGAQVCRLGSGWTDSFARLQALHGPWRLAALELLLRAADARASIMEAAGE